MSDTTTSELTRTVDGTEVPHAGTYSLDASHTDVGFSVRHLMVSKTKGRFSGVSGTIVIGDDHLASSVEVSIDVSSIDTRDATRDGHLLSPDFFDAEQYPVITYRSTKVTPAGKDGWKVDGELTVHGTTRPVSLDVTFEGGAQDPWGGHRIGFTAKGEVDREEFGLTWNQALETGGVLVGKVAKIEIEAEAVRQ